MLAVSESHALQILKCVEYPIVIKHVEDDRSIKQNSRRWGRMTWLQNNVQPPQSKESWHYKLLIECGYVKGTVMTTIGSMKIELPMPMDSHKMGLKKFSEMEEKTDAYLAMEYGIEIPDEEDKGI